jgi:hypothetical protein
MGTALPLLVFSFRYLSSKKYVTVTSFLFLEPAENCNSYIVPHV